MNQFNIADRFNQINRERIALGLGISGGCNMCPTCQGMGMLAENYGYGALDEAYGYGEMSMSDEEGGMTGGRRRKHKAKKTKKSGHQKKAIAYARRHHVSMPEAYHATR